MTGQTTTISVCTDRGPKPKNLRAEVTKNGPNRVCQRIFRENFKHEVYLITSRDFRTSYNATKK